MLVVTGCTGGVGKRADGNCGHGGGHSGRGGAGPVVTGSSEPLMGVLVAVTIIVVVLLLIVVCVAVLVLVLMCVVLVQRCRGCSSGGVHCGVVCSGLVCGGAGVAVCAVLQSSFTSSLVAGVVFIF